MPLRGTCRSMGNFFQNQSHGAQGTHTVPRGLPLAHLPSGWSRMPSRGCPEAAGSVSRWWEAKARQKNPPPQPLAASPSFWMPAPPTCCSFLLLLSGPSFQSGPRRVYQVPAPEIHHLEPAPQQHRHQRGCGWGPELLQLHHGLPRLCQSGM